MDKYTVIGLLADSFKSKEGDIIYYAKIFTIVEPSEPNKNLVGQPCEIISVKPDLLKNLNIGDIVEFNYNKFGRVSSINIL